MDNLDVRRAARNAAAIVAGQTPKDYDLEYKNFAYGGSDGIGVVAGTGVTSALGDGWITQIFTFTNAVMTGIDNAGVGGRAAMKFCDMPEGLIVVAAAVANLTLLKSSAGINADFDGDFGIGSVVADSGATLATTEQNIIPTTATPQAVAGATTAKGVSTAVVVLDGTATAVDLYLNILIDDADQDMTGTPANLAVNGTITLTYLVAGDK